MVTTLIRVMNVVITQPISIIEKLGFFINWAIDELKILNQKMSDMMKINIILIKGRITNVHCT